MSRRETRRKCCPACPWEWPRARPATSHTPCRYVGFGLFESGILMANCLANVGFSRCAAGVGRTEAVRDFVQRDEIEQTVASDELRLIGRHQALRDGQNDVIHSRVHEILPENLLRTFLLVDARIVR